MLTVPEKIIFTLATFATLYAAWRVVDRIFRTILRGQGKIDWSLARKRLISVTVKTAASQPVFRFRFWPSLFRGLIGWGFIYYILVNLGDTLEGFIPNFHFLGAGTIGDLYRL